MKEAWCLSITSSDYSALISVIHNEGGVASILALVSHLAEGLAYVHISHTEGGVASVFVKETRLLHQFCVASVLYKKSGYDISFTLNVQLHICLGEGGQCL